MNIRVEYDPTPIRHIAVQCDKCGKWFDGREIILEKNNEDILGITYSYEIDFARFKCPVCGHEFGYDVDGVNKYEDIHIEECGDAEEVFRDVLHKKETWE